MILAVIAFSTSMCGKDLVSCVANKYVPEKKAKKSKKKAERIQIV